MHTQRKSRRLPQNMAACVTMGHIDKSPHPRLGKRQTPQCQRCNVLPNLASRLPARGPSLPLPLTPGARPSTYPAESCPPTATGCPGAGAPAADAGAGSPRETTTAASVGKPHRRMARPVSLNNRPGPANRGPVQQTLWPIRINQKKKAGASK